MPRRHESERDFTLKATIRAVLWAQGYSTRLDVLLAYDKDSQGKNGSGKAGLTDLDVLGVRLDPGFRIHTAIADCKTTSGQARADRRRQLRGARRPEAERARRRFRRAEAGRRRADRAPILIAAANARRHLHQPADPGERLLARHHPRGHHRHPHAADRAVS